jgi:ATP-dependent Clp endopeptidase proteolytic subunit ClpP
MKKFFNITPVGDVAHIFIYGDIEDKDGKVEDIVSELLEIEQMYKDITVHINSSGGECYSGIAIVNALRQSKANIVIHVDGIAASMASVIALCGKPLYMSSYARLMLHSVKAGVYGDKEDFRVTIAEIEALEQMLCELVAGKMKKTAEEVRALYFDGSDHWITASEALASGLIDGIIKDEEVVGLATIIGGNRQLIDNLRGMTSEEVYKFQNKLLTEGRHGVLKNRTPHKSEEMNIEEIKKRTSFRDSATEADVLRVIDHLEAEAAKVAGLNEQVTALQGRVTEFENKAAAAVEAERTALLDAAIADERIKQPQRAHFEALLKADYENGKAVIESLTPKKRVDNYLAGGGSADGTSAWDKEMERIRKKNGLE